MCHVSAQGVDERMLNVHYYYYYTACSEPNTHFKKSRVKDVFFLDLLMAYG